MLVVIVALNLGPQITSPVLSLVIGEISNDGAASSAGIAMALMGLVTVFSSVIIGRLHGSFSIKNILTICCIGTGLLYVPPIWANTEFQLILMIGLTGLLVGGIFISSSSLVGMAVPISQQGIAYGLSQSAISLGSGIGPFIGGGLAPLIGLRPVFGVTAGVFILVGVLAARLIPERSVSVLGSRPMKIT